MSVKRGALRYLTAVLVAAATFTLPVSAQNVTEKFTGFAINLNGRAGTAIIDFTIERWSTDAERNLLLSLIKTEHKENDQLVEALQKMKQVGTIRTPQTLAWDLRYARQFKDEEGGRRIVLITDRPIGFGEARNQARTMDYPFTIIEFRLNARDEGEGRILGGAKIFVDEKKKELVVENWGQQPTRFNNIKKQK
jgi:hypothetical protein